MYDINTSDHMLNLSFRLEVLQTLDVLPIINKTMLQDSKVLLTVQRWADISDYKKFTQTPQSTTSIKPVNVAEDEVSPSDSGSATPISNDGVASPKTGTNLSKPSDLYEACIDSENPKTQPNADESIPTATTTTTAATTITTTTPVTVQSSDMLETIPHILEQNATIKGMNVDLLKRIISTNEKNVKIIEDAEKLPDGELGALIREICLLASKLVTSWEQLPESFKIPKKLRIEQMKEHEREADQSYKDNVKEETEQKIQNTYTSGGRFTERAPKESDELRDKDPRSRRSTELSKHKRRRLFEAKVCQQLAQDDAERKRKIVQMAFERRCIYFQLDPRTAREFMLPMCVDATTAQWYGLSMNKIPKPQSHVSCVNLMKSQNVCHVNYTKTIFSLFTLTPRHSLTFVSNV